MKAGVKILAVLTVIIIVLALILTGCGEREPIVHPDWPDGVFNMGDVLGVSEPKGFSFGESNDILAPMGICYVTWVCGDERIVTNESGAEAKAYDAQIYFLIKYCASDAKAQNETEQWIERESASYSVASDTEMTAAGQKFRILTLDGASESNPYQRGAAAFATREGLAIVAEMLCTDGFDGDPTEILIDFLEGIYY